MLLEILVAGGMLVLIGMLVACEVAVVETGRLFIPETHGDEKSPERDPIEVSDFLLVSRIATTVLALVAGSLAAHLWWAHESSITAGEPGIARTAIAALLVLAAVGVGGLVGYIIPHQIGLRIPERTLKALSPLARGIVAVFWPAMLLSKVMSKISIPGRSVSAPEEESIEEDIKTLVEEGERAGVIEEEEKEIISRVFKLGDKPLAALMTPRSDVVFLRESMTSDEALQVVLKARFTWYPVVSDDGESVVGVVSAHDVYDLVRNTPPVLRGLKGAVRSAMDVPESMTALELLESFREGSGRFAIVRDEYGSVAGIVTIDDVLKVIVGDLGSPNEADRSILAREDGSLLVDASSDVQNLFEALGWEDQDHIEQAPFHSVGGFVMTSLGHIPKAGDFFTQNGYRFEVVDMDGKRIDKVLVTQAAAKTAVGG